MTVTADLPTGRYYFRSVQNGTPSYGGYTWPASFSIEHIQGTADYYAPAADWGTESSVPCGDNYCLATGLIFDIGPPGVNVVMTEGTSYGVWTTDWSWNRDSPGYAYDSIAYTLSGAPTPSPTPGAGTTCDAPKVAGNQASCASCGGQSAGSQASPSMAAMAQYSIHSKLVSLNIQDRPLRYSPAYGPAVDFTVTYNQKETQQPATFNYANLGPKWTFGWLSYVSDDPTAQLPLTGVYRSGGGAEIFAYNNTSQSFVTDARTHANLVKTGAASYERRYPMAPRRSLR